MNIQEIQELKLELEKEILRLCSEFTRETTCKIDHINIESIVVDNMHYKNTVVTSVKLDVSL
jgi:hypothetical protein